MNVTENIMMNGMIVNLSPLFQTWEHPQIPPNRLNPRRCMIPYRVRITGILCQERAKLRDWVLCCENPTMIVQPLSGESNNIVTKPFEFL